MKKRVKLGLERPAKTHLVRDKMDNIIQSIIPSERAKVFSGMSEGKRQVKGQRNVRGFAREGWLCKRGRLHELKKSGRCHLEGSKCQMSSGKEQQHESSGNEREISLKLRTCQNANGCKEMQGGKGQPTSGKQADASYQGGRGWWRGGGLPMVGRCQGQSTNA